MGAGGSSKAFAMRQHLLSTPEHPQYATLAPVTALCVSKDSSTLAAAISSIAPPDLAAAGLEGTSRETHLIHLYDLQRSELLASLTGHEAPAVSVCLNGSGSLVAAGLCPRKRGQNRERGGDDGLEVRIPAEVSLWELPSGERRGLSTSAMGLGVGVDSSGRRGATCVDFGGTFSERLLAAGLDGRVVLWDLGLLADPSTAELGGEYALGLQPMPAAIFVPHPLEEGEAHLAGSSEVTSVGKKINAVKFSADALRAAVAVEDGSISVWAVVGRRNSAGIVFAQLCLLRGHVGPCTHLSFHPHDRTRLASAGADGTVRLWELTDFTSELARLRRLKLADDAEALQELSLLPHQICVGHEAAVQSLAFSPNGSLIASIDSTGCLFVWRANFAGPSLKAYVKEIFEGRQAGPLIWRPDSKRLYAGSQDGRTAIITVAPSVLNEILLPATDQEDGHAVSPGKGGGCCGCHLFKSQSEKRRERKEANERKRRTAETLASRHLAVLEGDAHGEKGEGKGQPSREAQAIMAAAIERAYAKKKTEKRTQPHPTRQSVQQPNQSDSRRNYVHQLGEGGGGSQTVPAATNPAPGEEEPDDRGASPRVSLSRTPSQNGHALMKQIDRLQMQYAPLPHQPYAEGQGRPTQNRPTSAPRSQVPPSGGNPSAHLYRDPERSRLPPIDDPRFASPSSHAYPSDAYAQPDSRAQTPKQSMQNPYRSQQRSHSAAARASQNRQEDRTDTLKSAQGKVAYYPPRDNVSTTLVPTSRGHHTETAHSGTGPAGSAGGSNFVRHTSRTVSGTSHLPPPPPEAYPNGHFAPHGGGAAGNLPNFGGAPPEGEVY